jgi:hypothetical protein
MNEPQNPAILALVGKKPEPASKPLEPAFQPQAIYFDTNALRGARWPKGNAQLLQVVQYAEWLGIRLCLPEVVRQELEGHWIRKVRNQWQNTNSQIATLSGMVKPLRDFSKLPDPPTREELLQKFRDASVGLTEKMILVSFTRKPLSDFVSMAIFREAAFNDSGRGFRDSVILCSVLEHMVASKSATGVLVSEDEDFQNAGVAQLTVSSKVELRILKTLDDIESLLKQSRNVAIRKYVEQEQRQLMDALTQRMPDLEKYLVENLVITPSDLRVWGTVKKVESLQLLEIENAHEGFFWPQERPTEPNLVRVSADVKLRLNLDVEAYSLTDPVRLKVGGSGTSMPDHAINPFAVFAEINAKSHDAVAVVEAEAIKGDTGYSDFRFTSTYLKRSDWGFGRYGNLFEGSK